MGGDGVQALISNIRYRSATFEVNSNGGIFRELPGT